MKKIVITNETGLHARPASKIVEMSQKFDGEIAISKNDKKANAKSIMSILSLGIQKGDEIVIEAEGTNNEQIETDLLQLIEGFDH